MIWLTLVSVFILNVIFLAIVENCDARNQRLPRGHEAKR